MKPDGALEASDFEAVAGELDPYIDADHDAAIAWLRKGQVGGDKASQ